jgi:signal-transduction protein with cAMP-binding, CBS, and nucleotidyltransferase domain
MSSIYTVVSPAMDVFDALQLMKDANVRHLPVMDDNKLVGFITMKDILKVQPHLFENIVDMWALREEDRKPLRGGRPAELEEE